MGLERGAVVEKLDGAWSARFSFRSGAWSSDQGTIDRSVERSKDQNWLEHGALDFLSGLEHGAVIRVQLTGAWSEDAKIGWSAERWRPPNGPH